MTANRIRYTWKDPDGSEHYEILEVEEADITSVEFYEESEG